MFSYDYNKDQTLNDKVAPSALDLQIKVANLSKPLLGVLYTDPIITVLFAEELDGDEAALTAVINAHDGVPLPSSPDIVAPTYAELPGDTHWKGNGDAPYICTAGAVTSHDFAIGTNDVVLYEGTYYVSAGAEIGDYVDFHVIDKDNVLGLGGTPASPTVVTTYIDNLAVIAGERRTMRSGKGAEIPAGLYLRTVYHSSGPTDVHFLVDFLCFEQPGS